MIPRKSSKTSKAKQKSSNRNNKTSQRKSTNRRGKKQTAPVVNISNYRVDIVGVILVAIGLFSLISLIASGKETAWVRIVAWAIGWGVFLFPLILILIGLWMLLRETSFFPQITLERATGIFLLILNLLSFLHFFTFPENPDASRVISAAGEGGGNIGGGIYAILVSWLGVWGTLITLLAWLLISLSMTFNVAVKDLFRWVSPLALKTGDWWDEWRAQRANSSPPTIHPPAAAYQTQPKFESAVSTQDEKVGESADSVTTIDVEPRIWELPPIDEMLDESGEVTIDEDFDRQRARVIEDTLSSFGAPATIVEINRGPTITQFGVEPGFIERPSGRTRVRVGKISALADDLALALAASRIRIQAPVPGKGYVGIEVPNEEITIVALRNVIESQAFTRLRSPLRFALGQDVSGNAIAADLAGMPHLLIAGATGSGKSVCVNAIINCLLLHNTPENIRMVMVDPKRVELTGYNGIPHLLAPVVVELERVVGALQWVLREMDQRYHKFAEAGARNIIEYNSQIAARAERTLPYLIVVIDELADLMMLAPDQTERALTRLAQLARATGIHLIVSTQRPSVDVVTGLIKANFPARIAFAVASGVDSRVILDQPGAERLLGRGDMLFQAPDAAAPVRLQGVFVSEIEILRVVQYWRKYSTDPDSGQDAVQQPVDAPSPAVPLKQMPMFAEMEPQEEEDPVLVPAIDLVRREGRASISMLQRRLRIGYTRAARLIDTMEERGIIGPPKGGAQAREVLDYGPTAPPQDD